MNDGIIQTNITTRNKFLHKHIDLVRVELVKKLFVKQSVDFVLQLNLQNISLLQESDFSKIGGKLNMPTGNNKKFRSEIMVSCDLLQLASSTVFAFFFIPSARN